MQLQPDNASSTLPAALSPPIGSAHPILREMDRLGLRHSLTNWIRLNYPTGAVALTAEVLAEMPDEIRAEAEAKIAKAAKRKRTAKEA